MSLGDHLSRTSVTRCLKRSTWNWRAAYVPSRTCFGWGLHGYICYQMHGSLLHCLFTLTSKSWRYISVALSRESPPPAVSRHPCPVKPGLSSPGRASSDHLSYFLQTSIICKLRLERQEEYAEWEGSYHFHSEKQLRKKLQFRTCLDFLNVY